LQNSLSAVQLVQASPPIPHWLSLSVPTHVAPAQQPLQLLGPHGALTHACDVGSHTFPFCVQSVHIAPPVPHASDDTPDTHAF